MPERMSEYEGYDWESPVEVVPEEPELSEWFADLDEHHVDSGRHSFDPIDVASHPAELEEDLEGWQAEADPEFEIWGEEHEAEQDDSAALATEFDDEAELDEFSAEVDMPEALHLEEEFWEEPEAESFDVDPEVVWLDLAPGEAAADFHADDFEEEDPDEGALLPDDEAFGWEEYEAVLGEEAYEDFDHEFGHLDDEDYQLAAPETAEYGLLGDEEEDLVFSELAEADESYFESEGPRRRVRFPSGEALPVVRGAEETEDDEYYDPHRKSAGRGCTRSDNPLLDTGRAQASKRLSKNFTVSELARSGRKRFSKARIDPDLIRCLQAIRDHVGKPVRITSGYRSWGYNRNVYARRKKKPTRSQHCSGRAADIKIRGMTGQEIALAAIEACGGKLGLGVGKSFAHIDVRGCLAVWVYKSVGTGSKRSEIRLAIRRHARRRAGRRPRASDTLGTSGGGVAGTAEIAKRARDKLARHLRLIADVQAMELGEAVFTEAEYYAKVLPAYEAYIVDLGIWHADFDVKARFPFPSSCNLTDVDRRCIEPVITEGDAAHDPPASSGGAGARSASLESVEDRVIAGNFDALTGITIPNLPYGKAKTSWPRISATAKDWAAKGPHVRIKVGGRWRELLVRVDSAGKLSIKQLGKKLNKQQLAQAKQAVTSSLKDKSFRRLLWNRSGKAVRHIVDNRNNPAFNLRAAKTKEIIRMMKWLRDQGLK